MRQSKMVIMAKKKKGADKKRKGIIRIGSLKASFVNYHHQSASQHNDPHPRLNCESSSNAKGCSTLPYSLIPKTLCASPSSLLFPRRVLSELCSTFPTETVTRQWEFITLLRKYIYFL